MAREFQRDFADVLDLLKFHEGDLISLSEVMEDTSEVVEKFHVVSPAACFLISVLLLLKAAFNLS